MYIDRDKCKTMEELEAEARWEEEIDAFMKCLAKEAEKVWNNNKK